MTLSQYNEIEKTVDLYSQCKADFAMVDFLNCSCNVKESFPLSGETNSDSIRCLDGFSG